MPDSKVGKLGITSYLPSPRSAKTLAGIGVALVVISSLGAYLYFCGPHLPASSMDWKFAAGGVALTGCTTVAAFMILRRSGTEKTEVGKSEKGKSIAATQKSTLKDKAEYVRAMEDKIKAQSYSDFSSEEEYQEIKQYLSDPQIVEETFKKTFSILGKYSEPLINMSLAKKLAKDFVNNDAWLNAMVKGIDIGTLNALIRDPSEYQITLFNVLLTNEEKLIKFFKQRLIFNDDYLIFKTVFTLYLQNPQHDLMKLLAVFPDSTSQRIFLNSLAYTDINWLGMILKKMKDNDPIMLVNILKLNGWEEFDSKLIIPLFQYFDFKCHDIFKNHEQDSLKQFLVVVMEYNDQPWVRDEVAGKMIMAFREAGRLKKILEIPDESWKQGVLHIGNYLTSEECGIFRNGLTGWDQSEFDLFVRS